MKRKFISAILFGALLVAPASVFVSCSDYDDDINSLQGQTDALKTQLAEQEAALEAALAQHKADFEAAKVAAAEALQAAQAAQAQGDKALAEAQAAKADAALAKQAAADAQAAAIAEAQKLVNALRQEIEDKGYALQTSLDAAVSRIAACEAELLKLKDIPTEVGNLTVKVDEHAKAIEALKTQVAAVEAYKALIDTNAASIKALEGKAAAADEAIKALQENIKTLATQESLNEAVKDLNERIDGLATQVASINAQLVTLQSSKLRALVFMPNLYADGIEAAEYGYLRYDALAGGKHADGANAAGHAVVFPNVTTDKEQATAYNNPVEKHFFPVVNVQYHLNPSSATVAAEQLSFVSRDVEVISRAASKANPTVANASQANGVLTVGMTADGTKISNDPKDACIFALQANIKNGGKDTTITSDYAMLYASTLTPKAIAFNDNLHGGKPCTGATILNNELYDDPVVALQKDPAFTLEYDDAQGFDISTILESHYVWNTQTKNAIDHGKWAYGEEAAYGLHYEYTLINYNVKGNETSDSHYATLTGSTIKANAVNSDGTANPSVQDQTSIGREPLVKVTVKDADGNVVLYGFIKVKIVREIGSKVAEEFAWNETVDYCNAKTVEVTWSQISAQVLSKLGMSNEEFHALYSLVGAVTTTGGMTTIDATQYIAATTPAVDGTKFTVATAAQEVGDVVEIVETEGQRTSKITWTLTPAEQAAIYESDTHSKTIYIAYTRKAEATDYAPLYLPLTVTFSRSDAAQNMESVKLTNYWKWGADKQPGINVPQPYDNGNTRNVAVDIHQVFEGNKIVFPTAYRADVTAGRYAYYFLPSTTPDNKYKLVAASSKINHKFTTATFDPSADNELKYAINGEAGVYKNDAIYLGSVKPENLIATINQTTGVITYYRPSAEPYTAAGKAAWYELLNAYGTNTLVEPQAFLKVGMVVWNECGVARAITDNELRSFNEYLLRPINVNANDNGQFVDAASNYSYVKLLDLLDFSDWRFEKFVDLQNQKFHNAWLFGFYRVLKCEVDLDNALTNMNQAAPDQFTAKLSAVAPNVKVNYLPGSATRTLNGVDNVFAGISDYAHHTKGTQATYNQIRDNYFGQLEYRNNGNPIGFFTDKATGEVVKDAEGKPCHNIIRVPVKITYDWGELATVWVDIKIQPSGALATNRK